MSGFGLMRVAMTPLKAARVLAGWSEREVAAALLERAAQLGVTVTMSRETVEGLLPKWEFGFDAPRGVWAELLSGLYGMSAAELGLETVEDERPLRAQAQEVLRRQRAYLAELSEWGTPVPGFTPEPEPVPAIPTQVDVPSGERCEARPRLRVVRGGRSAHPVGVA